MEEQALRKILSGNIKRYRNLYGWSQAALAEKIDISTNFLADIETGKSWVSSLTLIKLANIFGIEVYELFKLRQKADNETIEIMTRLVKDISISLNQALGQVSRQYLL